MSLLWLLNSCPLEMTRETHCHPSFLCTYDDKRSIKDGEEEKWMKGIDILSGFSERNKMYIHCRQRKEITTSSGIQAMMYLWWFPCSLFCLSDSTDSSLQEEETVEGKKWREKESWIYIRISMTHLTQRTRSTLINCELHWVYGVCVIEFMVNDTSFFCEKERPFITRVTSEVFVSWSLMIEFWCVFYWWKRR